MTLPERTDGEWSGKARIGLSWIWDGNASGSGTRPTPRLSPESLRFGPVGKASQEAHESERRMPESEGQAWDLEAVLGKTLDCRHY